MSNGTHTPTNFRCEVCGRQIERVEDGRLSWFEPDDASRRNLRLTHRECLPAQEAEFERDGAILQDLQLQRYLGSDGLQELLRLLTVSDDFNLDVIWMIIRLHVPGYEATTRPRQ